MEGNKLTFLLLLCFIGGIKWVEVCLLYIWYFTEICSLHFRKCHSETATCNPQSCKNSPCSTNVDCECLSLTNNSTVGVCAALVLSCTSLVRCNSDNRTCPIENTICVNNTRCQHPVCYPFALADKQICPSSVTTTTRMKYSNVVLQTLHSLFLTFRSNDNFWTHCYIVSSRPNSFNHCWW